MGTEQSNPDPHHPWAGLPAGPVSSLRPVKKFDTIHWRLPFSYAAIALLAAVALGILLLLILRGFYARQEQNYLQRNAQAIADQVAPFMREELPRAALRSQLEGYAFLTQTRVRLLDSQGRLLADSDELDQGTVATLSIQVDVGGVSQVFSQTMEAGSPSISYRSVIVVEEEGSRSTLMTADEVRSDSLVSAIPVALTPYGFGLGWSEEENPPRSSQRITWPVGASAGEGRLGYVELSAGPAYGGSILRRVAWGWAAASALAVLLAAVAGVAISRRLSQPLLDLTAVTLRMVAGNLAARANVKRQDELGTLALAFNEMAQRIEATILALRRFVSDAAHALQTPLTVLHSDLDLIRSRTSEAEQLARIERAWSQVIRLEALSAGLLELSRVEAKAGSQQPVSLHTIVKESSQFYASRAEQAGLTLSFDLPETEITILGDGTQLRHALDNLLDNAIKFNREGGAVSVSLRVEAGWNVLQVSDTGIGIPESDRPHLFRRFYRGGNAAETPGSGLGLAIVKAVVEAHAGSVSLESGFQGTTVILRLPVYR